MPDFSKRSDKEELMDSPSVPEDLFRKNLSELDWLNTHTGGHRISSAGLKILGLKKNKSYHAVDVGCGSGDSMKFMAGWARKNNYNIHFTGVDNSEYAIQYLHNHCKVHPEIEGVTADCFDYLETAPQVDIVHCSLFCHHLTDVELLRFLRLLRAKVTTGIVINDLKRSWAAWLSARWFTRLMKGSELSKHDGPLSVQKGFKKHELENLLQQAGFETYTIESRWPFRYLVTVNNQV